MHLSIKQSSHPKLNTLLLQELQKRATRKRREVENIQPAHKRSKNYGPTVHEISLVDWIYLMNEDRNGPHQRNKMLLVATRCNLSFFLDLSQENHCFFTVATCSEKNMNILLYNMRVLFFSINQIGKGLKKNPDH